MKKNARFICVYKKIFVPLRPKCRARAYARALCGQKRIIIKVQNKWKKKKSMMARVFKCSKD